MATRSGIRLHLVRNLDTRETTTRGGIPITTPERTLLDLAEVATIGRLRLAIDEVDRRNLFHPRHGLPRPITQTPQASPTGSAGRSQRAD